MGGENLYLYLRIKRRRGIYDRADENYCELSEVRLADTGQSYTGLWVHRNQVPAMPSSSQHRPFPAAADTLPQSVGAWSIKL